MAGMFAGGGDPYTPPIKNWETWQPQGPGPRQSGYVYGNPPNAQTGAYWTNQYNYQAPKMYQPNAENRWTVFGRPDQYPWANNPLGSSIIEDDPQAMAQAFLSAYGLGTTNNALTRFTRQQFPNLQDQYHVWGAQNVGSPVTFGDWVQNNAAQVVDKQWRDATAQQQGRNPNNFVSRIRVVGGGPGF